MAEPSDSAFGAASSASTGTARASAATATSATSASDCFIERSSSGCSGTTRSRAGAGAPVLQDLLHHAAERLVRLLPLAQIAQGSASVVHQGRRQHPGPLLREAVHELLVLPGLDEGGEVDPHVGEELHGVGLRVVEVGRDQDD